MSWLVALALATIPPVPAVEPAPIDPAAVLAAELERLPDRRPTVQVWVNGKGPFPFIVDTGANRTSISPALAARLSLTSQRQDWVNGVTGAELRPIVTLDRLEAGALRVGAIEAPIIEQAALGKAVGILAANEVLGQRVVLDFARKRYEVAQTSRYRTSSYGVRLTGELRFGHVLTLPCEIARIKAKCIIDTGSDHSIMNPALAEALVVAKKTEVIAKEVPIMGVAARPLKGDVLRMPRVQLGDIGFEGGAALVLDAPIFAFWGLEHEPSLFVGMNVLRAFDAVAIDYPRRTLLLREPPRLASLRPGR